MRISISTPSTPKAAIAASAKVRVNVSLEKPSNDIAAPRVEPRPANVNPILWQQSVGYARAACARIFRDGGSPADAMKVFGITSSTPVRDWSKAVERIAERLSDAPVRRAA